jgi:hypothetical protein
MRLDHGWIFLGSLTFWPNRKDLARLPPRDLLEAQYDRLAGCARICARTTPFLLAGRERDDACEKSRFPLVNRLSFETKGNVLKSTIPQS